MRFLIVTVSLLLLSLVNTEPLQIKKDIDDGKILDFLQSIPQSAKEEMDCILHNTTLTKGEMEKKLDAWAAKQPGDFPNRYNEAKNLLNTKFGPSAKTISNTAEKAISEIRQNKSITRLEERKAILDIMSKELTSEEENTFALSNNNLGT